MITNLLTFHFADLRFIEILILSAANTVLMYFASFKFLQTLQQCGYDSKEYKVWLKRRDNIYMLRLFVVSVLSLLAFLVFNIATVIFTDAEWVFYIGFAFYLLFFIFYIVKDRETKSRVPLVKTARIRRLLVTFVSMSFIWGFIMLLLINLTAFFADKTALLYKLRYGVLCFTPLM